MSYRGSVLRGEATNNLDQFALLDRIINVKFTRRSGLWFTIRSDYEVKVTAEGKPYFTPIRQKPEIKVSYKQVAQGTSIDVFIRVTNLFFDRESQDTASFNDDPIIQADVHMGYRTQFPDWAQGVLSNDTEETAAIDSVLNRLRMFNSMAQFEINGTDVLDTSLILSTQIIAIYNEGNPPDRVTVFHGIVGSMDYGLKWSNRSSLSAFFKESGNFPPLNENEKPLSFIEQVFWFYITSRFVRHNITHRLYSDTAGFNPAKTDIISEIQVFDYDVEASPRRFFTEEEQLNKSLAQRWATIKLDSAGIMSVEDASVLGVVVIVTNRVIEASEKMVSPQVIPGGETDPIANRDSVLVLLQLELYEESQMFRIKNQFPFIRWTRLPNGDFLVYHVDEAFQKVQETFSDPSDRVNRPLLLPAIYDITVSSMRTIRCPFIGFLAPSQLIGFSSRYTISDLIGFYYPLGEDAFFRVILAEVSFSTTDDDNMMVLTCVDEREPVIAVAANENTDITEEEAEAQRGEVVVRWNRSRIGQWLTRNAGRTGVGAIDTWATFAQVAILDNTNMALIENAPKRTGSYWSDVANAINYILDADTGDGTTNRDISKSLIAQGRARDYSWEYLESVGVKGAADLALLWEWEDSWYVPTVVASEG